MQRVAVIVWGWTQHAVYRSRYEEALAGGMWQHTEVFRLRSRSEVEDFLAGLHGRSNAGEQR